jgi:hypothetical protein
MKTLVKKKKIDKTLHNFIVLECCNFVRNSCVGVSSTGMFNNTGICVVIGEEPKHCDYFKDCVIPTSKHRMCYNEILNKYSDVDNTIKRVKIRTCQCGSKLDKGERLCSLCKKTKRKLSFRKINVKRKR